MKARWTWFILLSLVLSQFSMFLSCCYAMEVDKTVVVSRVIDGDTFEVSSGQRVRLADIDAPENGQAGFYEAKNVLSDLVLDKTVYLDIDDLYQTDKYGRLVCVVYVRVDSSSYKNVNKALLMEGVAVIKNYNNEFNPYSWTLYENVNSSSDVPAFPFNLTDFSFDFHDEPEEVNPVIIVFGILVVVAIALVALIVRQDKIAKIKEKHSPNSSTKLLVTRECILLHN